MQTKSIEFEIVGCENSIRWLQGETTPNETLIAKHRRQIKLLKEQLTGANLNLQRDEHGFFEDISEDRRRELAEQATTDCE